MIEKSCQFTTETEIYIRVCLILKLWCSNNYDMMVDRYLICDSKVEDLIEKKTLEDFCKIKHQIHKILPITIRIG